MSSAAILAELLADTIGDNSEEQEVKSYLDTGMPNLNKIISGRHDGGIPNGRVIEIYGPSSAGKTALATKLMIETQRAGGIATFLDHERTFSPSMAQNMGLTLDRPFYVYKSPETWEESNDLAAKMGIAVRGAKLIPDEAPMTFVFDSVAAMIPKSVAEKKSLGDLNMNDTTALARVTSTTLKHMAFFASKYNLTLIYLNQIRTKPGVVYGDPTTTPGGVAMEFFASVRLALSRKKVQDKDKEFIGQIIGAKCVKSKLTKPFQTTDVRMSFNEDGSAYFDHETTLIEYLLLRGKLKQSGARVEWNGKSYFKSQLADVIRAEGSYAELLKMLD